MKRSEAIFFSVLVLSIFLIAACQVGPGGAVKKPTPDAPKCKAAGQACNATGGFPCCGSLNCISGVCTATQQNCTQSTVCSGSYLNTTSANCTTSSTLCQYGCSNNSCNPPPGNQTCVGTIGGMCSAVNKCCTGLNCVNGKCEPITCTPSTVCLNANTSVSTNVTCGTATTSCQYGCNAVTKQCNPPPSNQSCTASTVCYTGTNLNVTTANCTRYTTPCQYGCQIGSGVCNSAPSNCTPSTFCTGNYQNTTYSNCTRTSTLCQYGCSGGQCNGAPSNCTQTCFDSDGGINANLTGNISGVYSNCTSYSFTEGCASSNVVGEYYCSGGQYLYIAITCPSGQSCVSGHCQ